MDAFGRGLAARMKRLLIAPAGWYCWTNVWKMAVEIDGRPSDFTHYHLAAKAVLAGQSPYTTPYFTYPPLFAFLLAPLGAFDYVTARWIWFGLSQVFLLLAAWITYRATGRDQAAALAVAAVWAFSGAAGENLALGQIGPLLLLLVALAQEHAAAAAGGLALKFFPGILGAQFALRRDWRGLVRFGVMAGLLISVPWGIAAGVLQGRAMPMGSGFWNGSPALLNWSLPAVALRIAEPPEQGKPMPHNWLYGNDAAELRLTNRERMLAVGVALGTLALGLAVLWRLGKRLSWTAGSAALMALMLAAAPVSWTHYQLLQGVGIAGVLGSVVRQRRWGEVIGVVVCGLLLYPIPVAALSQYYHQHGGWSTASPVTLYFWTSVAPLASLGLFGLALASGRERGQ